MYHVNFDQAVHVHFTGIGGISMSALAEILLSKGFQVSGSDTKSSNITKNLEQAGAVIHYAQAASNITSDIDVLVYTAAIHPDNPEIVRAKELQIPMLTRAQFLGQMMKNYNIAIGVSGTHGKTTTTSMLSEILLENESDPTILVGGMLNRIGGNLRIGHSGTMITEACEYTNSFLSFFPTLGIILNVKEDHLDFFKDINDIRNSFRKYCELIPADGSLVINGEIDDLDFFTHDLPCKVITYGLNNISYDYSAANITFDKQGKGSFDLYQKEEKIGHISLNQTGEHNISNALAAIAAARDLGISLETIQAGFTAYTGTDRRFQYKGTFQGVTVIDDYAHHPDEIAATLKAAAKYPHKKLWVVFQPHTYSRTYALFSRFADALSKADAVVLADIFAARETDTLGMSSELLAQAIRGRGTESYYFPSFEEIENFLKKNCIDGDLLITMGAGDVVLVGEELISK